MKLTKAFHGSGIETETGEFLYGDMPAVISLTMGDQTFYHAGDTDLFSDMRLIGDFNNIAIAALPNGNNFTMGL